ncbi:hypothetical protein PHMEG_00021857 [Phytophthora megakarya]|uniref:Uncharacterized protein n=1 Tax=Phytophthora megakarya TaxID=4795 RepID=A0A225VLS1_9STRA|nr:hypothetical protein PHMEG_00021857 [Phytophthora megakarya]
MTSLTITDKTLRTVLPHLAMSGEWSPLASKLLNQKLIVRGSVHFEWDAARGQVNSRLTCSRRCWVA